MLLIHEYSSGIGWMVRDWLLKFNELFTDGSQRAELLLFIVHALTVMVAGELLLLIVVPYIHDISSGAIRLDLALGKQSSGGMPVASFKSGGMIANSYAKRRAIKSKQAYNRLVNTVNKHVVVDPDTGEVISTSELKKKSKRYKVPRKRRNG